MGERRGVCRVLVEKPEGKRPLERPRYKWVIILRWIFRKWDGGMGCIYLAQDRDRGLGTCECGNEHSGSIKHGNFLAR